MQFFTNYIEAKSEFDKCKEDVVYFMENQFLKAPLYPSQVGALYNYEDNDRFVLNASRRSGKTTISMGYALWVALFQEEKKIAVMNINDHMSSLYSRTLREKLEDIKLEKITKDCITFENGSEIHFLRDTGHPSSSVGRSFDHIDLQDCAYYTNFNKTLSSLLPAVSRNGGKLILSSNKSSLNESFYQLYADAKWECEPWKSQAINWWDVPGRTRSWAKEMEKNIGKEHFDREFLADF